MPYAILECTDNLKDAVDYQALFSEFHQIIHDIIGAPKHVCKSYMRQIRHSHIGEGRTEDALVKLELCLLAGRTPEAKQALGEALLSCLKRYFPLSNDVLALQVGVRLVEMAHDDYFAYDSQA